MGCSPQESAPSYIIAPRVEKNLPTIFHYTKSTPHLSRSSLTPHFSRASPVSPLSCPHGLHSLDVATSGGQRPWPEALHRWSPQRRSQPLPLAAALGPARPRHQRLRTAVRVEEASAITEAEEDDVGCVLSTATIATRWICPRPCQIRHGDCQIWRPTRLRMTPTRFIDAFLPPGALDLLGRRKGGLKANSAGHEEVEEARTIGDPVPSPTSPPALESLANEAYRPRHLPPPSFAPSHLTV